MHNDVIHEVIATFSGLYCGSQMILMLQIKMEIVAHSNNCMDYISYHTLWYIPSWAWPNPGRSRRVGNHCPVRVYWY